MPKAELKADSEKRAKATKIEKDKRVRAVMEWLLEGHITVDIITSCISQWGIDERMAYKYLKEARKEFLSINASEIEELTAFHVEARMKLFKNLLDKNKPGGASVGLMILQDIAKLKSLYPQGVQKIDLTSKGNAIGLGGATYTDKQFNALLEAARKDTIKTDSSE